VIRIVGIQKSPVPEKEFILLQNQGSLRIKLRGHVVASDHAFEGGQLDLAGHAFKDDVLVPAGMFVILFSGSGTPRWARTKEGQMIFYAYMERVHSVWNDVSCPVHMLATQHSYAERPTAVLLK
jgi:hypothetical protein